MANNDARAPQEASAQQSARPLGRRALLRLACALPTAVLLSACGAETPQVSTSGAGNTLMPVVVKPTAPPSPAPTASRTSQPAPTPQPSLTPRPAPTRFAVIGDYGTASDAEAAVAALVAGWGVEFVVTVGDNNYPDGAAATIDANVGQFYHAFIHPYRGAYGAGADRQRFFPTLGNHDWRSDGARPALEFFSMPARYYTFAWGAAQFFMLDSDPNEPDGVSADSAQAAWLRAQLAASQARWKLVAFHHPPFSSGLHGPSAWMQWPFAAWGAHAVLGGHDHTYERIERDGALYFVNGLGGASRYAAGESPAAGSRIFYNASHGAMLVTLDERGCEFQFVAIGGEVIDRRALGGA